ncbi:MICAL-like protein 2 [Sinocyclocheilus anshuiensis]|uniref:MICAL-like protein 2 n=1 Tax=Sinocyclocheilus anshuiensis TaxID=1608454 RepID=UPI0007B88073|nr:PREDICTED: MICAL-like protein 2 [Sinocyclocheilus anshuiensis]
MAAIKALQQWCKVQCEGYRDVTISNMSTSFRDGLAFCALIHKFRPDLINFESLSKDDVYYNNHLAFLVAEDHLGIPALLDAEDMVALPVPDRLSILTYVSQYHNYFRGRSPIGGVGGIKRHAEDSKEMPSEKKNLPVVAKNHNLKTNTENRPPQTEMPKNIRDNRPPSLNIQKSAPEKHIVAISARQTGTDWQKSPGPKCVQVPVTPLRVRSPQPHTDAEKKAVLVENSNKTGTLNSECAVCGNHVHLVQRHLDDGKLYHRSCFKCSVCYGTLKSGAYKLGADVGSLVCTIHQHGQNDFKPTVKPFKSSGFTLADLVPKSDRGDQPSSQRYTSVLSAPIKAVPRPVELSHALQSWTASAQRTQEARQKFFQSCGPAAEHRPTTRQQSGPSESCTNQNTSLKMEEKDRASALTNGKLFEGNTNNNNALNSDPGAQRQIKIRFTSAEVSSWKQELHGRDATGSSSYQATSTSSAISSSGMNTKVSLYLSAISKERNRPPSLLLSTAKGGVRSQMTFASKDAQSCEAPTDWRSKPKAAPNGPRLKSPDIAKDVLLTCGKNKSDHCLTAQNDPASTITNSSCSKRDCSLSSCILSSQSCHKPSSPKQPRRGSATSSYDNGNISSKNGLLCETRLPTIKPCYIAPDQISKELQDIENKLYNLENEGVELERRLCIYEEEGHGDLLLDPLMVDWFNLILKKQSHIRRESELMYIARTQDLEEQQPGVEGELRRLISKPEHFKTLDEKKRETELLNRLMKIVNDRNTIVEGLEEDRIREEEEDQKLNEMMQRLGLQKYKNKCKPSFSKLFRRRSKKASMG